MTQMACLAMEPLSGLEPETFRLQGGCSTN